MHADAAPDVDRGAVDEGRVVRDEEDDQPVDIFRLFERPIGVWLSTKSKWPWGNAARVPGVSRSVGVT
jgi:hypothetical protein